MSKFEIDSGKLYSDEAAAPNCVWFRCVDYGLPDVDGRGYLKVDCPLAPSAPGTPQITADMHDDVWRLYEAVSASRRGDKPAPGVVEGPNTLPMRLADTLAEFSGAVWNDCRFPIAMRESLGGLFHNHLQPLLREVEALEERAGCAATDRQGALRADLLLSPLSGNQQALMIGALRLLEIQLAHSYAPTERMQRMMHKSAVTALGGRDGDAMLDFIAMASDAYRNAPTTADADQLGGDADE